MRYFDLHCDTITECKLQRQGLYNNNLHLSLERSLGFKPYVQFFAIWMPDSLRGIKAVERFDDVYVEFLRQMAINSNSTSFCTDAVMLETAIKSEKNAAFLSIEGGAAFGGRIERLSDAAKKGVKLVTLTWNGTNELGDGCMNKQAGGLTPFGFEVVRNMKQLKMIVDVSHLSQKGFSDVLKTTDAPFIASHSNAKAICDHPRNLTDEQIKEIAARKGLIGLNLYPFFVKQDGRANLEDIIAHADHILSLVGENILAVGADFDGATMPPQIKGIEDMSKLYELMLNKYHKTIADKVFFDNAYKFISSTLT